jgi:tRNA(adenine34) deaminase
MANALELAEQAYRCGEVPVGAVVVLDGRVVGEGFNHPIQARDATSHAEVAALRDASARIGNYRLPGTTVYVTVEPCMMCAGALIHARVDRLVFGAIEPKAGAVVSHPVARGTWLNHQFAVEGGVCADECAELMSRFFAERRERNRKEH